MKYAECNPTIEKIWNCRFVRIIFEMVAFYETLLYKITFIGIFFLELLWIFGGYMHVYVI